MRNLLNQMKLPQRLPLGSAAACALLMVGCSPAKPESTKPLSIVVSGDTAGWIVPCGCTSNQSGGLLRRGGYLRQLSEDREVVYLDCGGAGSGTSPYDFAKFEAILAGEQAMGVKFHNVGASEVAFLANSTPNEGNAFPGLHSANVTADLLSSDRYQILKAAGKRILVIGVLSNADGSAKSGHEPARDAVLGVLAKVKRGDDYDFAILLAYAAEEELVTLAKQLPELDAVIGGPTGQAIVPRKVGATWIGAATNKGKFLVQLDFPANGDASVVGKAVEMAADLPEDPEQIANLEAFYQRLAQRDFSASETSFSDQTLFQSSPSGTIAGHTTCQSCHEEDYQLWSQSAHAHAWKTLVDQKSDVDPYCQQCHVTGYGVEGGFVSRKQSSDRVDVSCESCHGPSDAHRNDPSIRTAYFGNAKVTCVRCHDHENSPEFDYQTYWEQIEHGKGSSG
ncbi:multiheme c-type cytochrome [Bremerella cremea]|uniref:multiheme c-type cytochrome n=1 Tax=Bremerella cremea TaxID=1031537 RepID=UPI0031EA03C2